MCSEIAIKKMVHPKVLMRCEKSFAVVSRPAGCQLFWHQRSDVSDFQQLLTDPIGHSRLLDFVSGTLCRRTLQHLSYFCLPSVTVSNPPVLYQINLTWTSL